VFHLNARRAYLRSRARGLRSARSTICLSVVFNGEAIQLTTWRR